MIKIFLGVFMAMPPSFERIKVSSDWIQSPRCVAHGAGGIISDSDAVDCFAHQSPQGLQWKTVIPGAVLAEMPSWRRAMTLARGANHVWIRICWDCNVPAASGPQKSEWAALLKLLQSSWESSQVATAKTSTWEFSFSEFVRSGVLVGTWLDGCRRQQPIPQHRPSAVPQQQVVRENLTSLPDPNDCAETGVQTTATLVLIASRATRKTRIGFDWRYMAVANTARCDELFDKSYNRRSLMAINLARAAKFDARAQVRKAAVQQALSLDSQSNCAHLAIRLLDRRHTSGRRISAAC
jgi:hypothetical protein